jgi:hypothetical protein
MEPQSQAGTESRQRVILPKNVLGGTWKDLIVWGFRPTGIEDEIFREVDLPVGWILAGEVQGEVKRVLTDARRRHRAIYYTDSNQLGLRRRYDVVLRSVDSQFASRKIHCYEVVDAGQQVLFKTDEVADPQPDARESMRQVIEEERQRLYREAVAWLNTNYPNWEDATAHWD